MPIQLVFTVVILVVAVALLLTDRLRADMVALLVVVALGAAGVLAPREAFSGFASSAVVTIVAIFVFTEALRVTGVTGRAGDLLQRAVSGVSEQRLVLILMLAGAGLSLVMNNIAAAAVLLPAVSGIARRIRVSPSRLLMPLAFATILGGMATLFTTTNIVVSGILRGQNLPGFGVLSFAPIGVPLVSSGIAYMALWGRNRLPHAAEMDLPAQADQAHFDPVEVYRLGERLFRARVPAASSIIGRPLAGSGLREQFGVNVIALERAGRVIPAPLLSMVLAEGDILLLEGKLDQFREREAEHRLEIVTPHEQGAEASGPLPTPSRDWRAAGLETSSVIMIEAVLAPRSTLLGQTLRSARFREKYGMSVLAIWRAGRPIRTGLSELPLAFGDALLLQGERDHLTLLRTEPDLIVLDRGEAARPAATVSKKGLLAVAIMAASLILAAFNAPLVGEILLGGALAIAIAGILTMDQGYQAIEWRSVFLVAGMLPLGLAMTQSGAAALVGRWLVAHLSPFGPLALLAGVLAATVLLTQTMTGAAVATVMAPIAMQAAQQAGLNPRSFAMGVALATSMAFITPLGHPVNVLVMGPGGYHFRDYARVGLPLTVVLLAVVMVFLPLFWPLVAK